MSGRPTRRRVAHASDQGFLGLVRTPQSQAEEFSQRASGIRGLRAGSDTRPTVSLTRWRSLGRSSPRQSDGCQSLELSFGIDPCGLERLVAQDIGYLFEARTLVEHLG